MEEFAPRPGSLGPDTPREGPLSCPMINQASLQIPALLASWHRSGLLLGDRQHSYHGGSGGQREAHAKMWLVRKAGRAVPAELIRPIMSETV